MICPIYNLNIQSGFFHQNDLSANEVRNIFKEREKKLVNGIELIDGIIIRRISKEDVKLLQPRQYFTPYFKLSPGMFILEKKISTNDKFKTSKKMFEIILALRLLREGYVSGSGVIYFIETKKGNYRDSSSAFSESPRKWEQIRNSYLNFEDFSPLIELIHRIEQAKIYERKHVHLAVKRFNRSYERPDIDDKLIDLMIAFEILFLKGENVRAPTGVVIGVGCSMLLGKNNKEREEINRVLVKAYSIRNKIVHGGSYKQSIQMDKEYSIYEFVNKVEHYLRESIKKLL